MDLLPNVIPRFAVEVVSVVHPISPEARPPTVTTARIVTLFSLDREEITSYCFTVVVMDTTTFPLNATATVVITVEDVNDNTPQFSSANFSLEVPEETVNETFVAEFVVRAFMATMYWAQCTIQSDCCISQQPDKCGVLLNKCN